MKYQKQLFLVHLIFVLILVGGVLGRKTCSCMVKENTSICCKNVKGKELDNGNCLINIYVTPFFNCCKDKSENNESGTCKNIH